jgi:hypothetical protein
MRVLPGPWLVREAVQPWKGWEREEVRALWQADVACSGAGQEAGDCVLFESRMSRHDFLQQEAAQE